MHRLEDNYSDFINRLRELQVDDLAISEYNKIYLKKHLESLEYSVHLASEVLDIGLNKSLKPKNQISVAEIGGGTGIISLLARWSGFGKVVYSDTYQQSCHDFEVISKALDLKPDNIIEGSIIEIASKYPQGIDLIVSRDVIEHIYDPGLFLKQSIQYFANAVMVHNTSANIYNIFKQPYFKKLQLLDETSGNPNQFKPGDSTQSFYEMRYKFIHSNFSKLPEKTIKTLAISTRGKIYHDIYTDVKMFIETGKMPELQSHSYNTCDPANGNWTEHLLTFEEYESYIKNFDYNAEWYYSPYDQWRNSGLKRIVLKMFNAFIKNAGPLARYIAPAVILVLVPKLKGFQQ